MQMESATCSSCVGVLLLRPPLPPAAQNNHRPSRCTPLLPLSSGLTGPVCLLHRALRRLLCVRLQARVRRLLPAPAVQRFFCVRTDFNRSLALPCPLRPQSPAAVMSVEPSLSPFCVAAAKHRSSLPRSPCTLSRSSLHRSSCTARLAPSRCSFKIKDFGDSIPGHGGVTDRFDCQVSGLLPLCRGSTRFRGRPAGLVPLGCGGARFGAEFRIESGGTQLCR